MKILIVQTSFLGDTILSTPVIAGVEKTHPGAEIWMMTTPLSSALIRRDPLLTGVIPYDKRGKDRGFRGLLDMAKRLESMGFDKVFSLHRSYRTAVLLSLSRIPFRTGFSQAKFSFLYHRTFSRKTSDHDVLRNLTILSEHGDPGSFETDLRLFAPDASELTDTAKSLLPEEGKTAVLVPGSAWETKMWHHEGFRKTADYLSGKGFHVILLGSPDDTEVNRKVAEGTSAIDLAGKTSISDALYIMKHASLVVCNDSMSLHMASAFKIPTVVIFCATSPTFGFGPWKNRARIVEKTLDCKPCSRHGGRKCPMGTDACMTEIPFSDVTDAIDDVLDLK
jgi:heptosyltransferase-2